LGTLFLSFSGVHYRAALSQPSTAAKIPFNAAGNSTRKPANIPLHTLSSASRRGRSRQESYDEKYEDRQRLRRSASFDADDDDEGSEFSLWSDTGDLVDQLAEQEDPLAVRLEEQPYGSHRRGKGQQKSVRYASANGHGEKEKPHRAGVVKRKEDIPIPNPPPRRLNWGERLLARIMAPGDGPSRMHGLHGKKLIYFLSIFVSLGVFLLYVSQTPGAGQEGS